MCKITYYVWNKIIQGSLSRSVWKKFLSLEKFYTHIVADVADYYEVCVEAERARDKTQEAYTVQQQTRKPIKPLEMGQRVWLQDHKSKKWTIEGVIKSIQNSGRRRAELRT